MFSRSPELKDACCPVHTKGVRNCCDVPFVRKGGYYCCPKCANQVCCNVCGPFLCSSPGQEAQAHKTSGNKRGTPRNKE